MFFALALVAALAYATQTILLAPLFREIPDRIAVVFYRGICIGLCLAPTFLFIPRQDFFVFFNSIHFLVLAGVLVCVGTWASINALNCLAVGIATTLFTAASTFVITVVSVVILDEPYSSLQLALGLVLLVCILILGLAKSQGVLPPQYNPSKGILYCALFGLFTGPACILVGVVARQANPILAAATWELFTGVIAGICWLIKNSLEKLSANHNQKNRLSLRSLIRFLVPAIPTSVATSCYAMAMRDGNIAIVSMIVNLNLVFVTVYAAIWFREKLSKLQVAVLILTVGLLSALKFTA